MSPSWISARRARSFAKLDDRRARDGLRRTNQIERCLSLTEPLGEDCHLFAAVAPLSCFTRPPATVRRLIDPMDGTTAKQAGKKPLQLRQSFERFAPRHAGPKLGNDEAPTAFCASFGRLIITSYRLPASPQIVARRNSMARASLHFEFQASTDRAASRERQIRRHI